MSNPTRTQTVWLAPGEKLDIGWDWTDWLTPADTIAGHTCTATGVTVETSTHDTTRTVARVTGGVAGVQAVLTTTITTTGGEVAIGVHRIDIG